MSSPGPHDLLREFASLNRRRKDEGISPLELQRWLDLRNRLAKAFPDRPPLPASGTTRLRVEFATRLELRRSIMVNVRPIGLFVGTPFALEPGASFDLSVLLKETGEELESPVVVVSNNVGPDFSTADMGMGLRFAARESTLRTAIEALYGPVPGAPGPG